MTNNEGEAWGGVELDRAEAELRQVLAVRMQRAVPADLVVTTRTEIEKREFTAYGQGWRDRGEHEEQRRRAAATLRTQSQGQAAPPRLDAGGKILPFPQQTPPPAAPPHPQRTPPPAAPPHPQRTPHPHPHPPGARPHPSDGDL